MKKYSENPIDNIEGYLDNIEKKVEKMSEVPSLDGDKSEVESMKTDVGNIRNDINKISKSMNTVAEAIGTVPTEEERKRQHEDDLQFIINNTKSQVTVDLDPLAKAMLKKVTEAAGKLSGKLDNLADNFESRMEKVVERKAESDRVIRAENWIWRLIAQFCVISLFLLWLIPKVKEMNSGIGTGGFLLLVIGIILVFYSYFAVYKWGKSQGNGWP